MKKIFFLIIIINLSNCNPKDCFDSTGDIIQTEINLDTFDKIEVGNEVTLILKQGNNQKVIIETGENIINDVTVEVIDGKLYIKDESSCNLTRDYAVTKVFVTSPNIKVIRSDTSRDIMSDGILNYNDLTLISEDFTQNSLNIGDFNIKINTQTLKIVSNGNSLFNISGNTNNLTVGFYSGSSRFTGDKLISNYINIIQKSSNDILVFPIIKLEGDIFSIGDVISFNTPEIIQIEEHGLGKLIFE